MSPTSVKSIPFRGYPGGCFVDNSPLKSATKWCSEGVDKSVPCYMIKDVIIYQNERGIGTKTGPKVDRK